MSQGLKLKVLNSLPQTNESLMFIKDDDDDEPDSRRWLERMAITIVEGDACHSCLQMFVGRTWHAREGQYLRYF